MEDLIREARELKEKVRGMLLTYQYREKILSGEDRDIPADKLYNALVCLGDFASIVESRVLTDTLAPTGYFCPNCKQPETVKPISDRPSVFYCSWCNWSRNMAIGEVLSPGDSSKQMP